MSPFPTLHLLRPHRQPYPAAADPGETPNSEAWVQQVLGTRGLTESLEPSVYPNEPSTKLPSIRSAPRPPPPPGGQSEDASPEKPKVSKKNNYLVLAPRPLP